MLTDGAVWGTPSPPCRTILGWKRVRGASDLARRAAITTSGWTCVLYICGCEINVQNFIKFIFFL